MAGRPESIQGIAEYHGPRSQMMRCIDHPTMLKDGSGWGAKTGVSAAMLARSGFTGAPALTVEEDAVQEIWSTLGNVWEMDNLYFKPYAICRWAQPAVEGMLLLQKKHCIAAKDVFRIEVRTFHQGVCLAGRFPENTEQAQYSIAYPLAAAMYAGRLGYRELSDEILQDQDVCILASKVEVSEDEKMSACFPQERWARVQVSMNGGQIFDSGPVQAKWDAQDPPSDQELREKFRQLAREAVESQLAEEMEEAVWKCAESHDVQSLMRMFTSSPYYKLLS